MQNSHLFLAKASRLNNDVFIASSPKKNLHYSSKKFAIHPLLGVLASLFFVQKSTAQTNNTTPILLPEVVVTALPLGNAAAATPSTVLQGDELTLKKSNSLGEMLGREPGVSSTHFGSNASRPVIRGFDGDRIRILSNGGALHDVSGLSFDHAAPLDPLVIDRVEIVRGPATLLHGGGAVGGVVNTFDNRVPKVAMTGLAGLAELRVATAAGDRNASAMIETPLSEDKTWGLHLDGFNRKSNSLAVPIALPCSASGTTVIQHKICNTDATANGGALGVSRVFDKSYLGVSLSTYTSQYGTPAEDEVKISMRNNRLSVQGELNGLQGLIQTVAGQLNRTNYSHTELDAGVPATEFNKHSTDAALTAAQKAHAWGASSLGGTSGLSYETTQFSALGAEAFVPRSTSKQLSMFTVQTLTAPWGALSFGARLEQVRLTSLGGIQTDYAGASKFTENSQRFTPINSALGGVFQLAGDWQLTGNLSHSERAPSTNELYANGAHIATSAYEVGNIALKKEASSNLDLALKWNKGRHSASVGAFYNRFSNYVNLSNTGLLVGADGEPNPLDLDGDGVADSSGEDIFSLYRYQPIRARFMGVEAQGKVQLTSSLSGDAKFDVLRANNAATGEALPRIAPMRLTVGLGFASGGLQTRVEIAHNAAQTRFANSDSMGRTASYSIWNLSASYRQKQGLDLLWFARLENVGNSLGYNATTIDTVRGKSPMAGRNLKLGVQLAF